MYSIVLICIIVFILNAFCCHYHIYEIRHRLFHPLATPIPYRGGRGVEIYFSSRLNFSCLGFLDFSCLLFWPYRVLRRIYKSLLNKKNIEFMHRRGIEPGPTGWEVAILTSRPTRLVDIGGRFPIVMNVVNNVFLFRKSIQGITEARKVKLGEKTPFLSRFL